MEYANSSNTIFTLNYTGVVNYYYYDENNIKQDLSFECKNACFRVDSVGNIYWKSGEFLSGDWYNGQWLNQISQDNGQTWKQSTQIVSFWKNGVWHNGKFYNGIWENGFFNSGHFYFGYWLNGVFGYDSLIKDDVIAIWHNGYFYGGVFSGTLWESGSFYTNSDVKSYWMTKEKDNYLLWQSGYVNNQYSNSSPPQTVYNNGQYTSVSGRVTYLIIKNNDYKQYQFVCANASFNINTIGQLTINSGNYYNGQFFNIDISNSMLNGFQLQQCRINNCNISQSILLNCEINNSYQNNISNSQWYNGYFNGGYFIQSVWYDGVFNGGYFSKSIWYNGQWNKNKLYESYWQTDSEWYGGYWYGGYVDHQWSDTSPYIIGNGKTYDMFTGQLLYKYNQQDYVIQLNNAGISIEIDGTILFINGVWKNGVFNKGLFINSQFENGTFNDGQFQNSIWQNGNFNNGVFYSSVWNNGYFNGGVFDRSDWNNGYFTNGQFKSGKWYNGYFNGGNWNTLNSFWFDGVWLNGTQNGVRPDNYSDQTYVCYLTKQQLVDNMYVVELLTTKVKIQLFDSYNNNIELQIANNYDQIINIGYFFSQQKLYLCFKNQFEGYFKLKYTYVLTDVAPKFQLITDYEQYLNKDVKNLISGQFTYIVQNQNNQQQYYTISVEDANFTIQNGFINWNNGTFKNGIWYNGQWNTNITQFFQLMQPINQQLLNKLQQCVWQNGIWMNGNWNYQQSIWKKGEWLKGTINNIESEQPPNFQLGNGKNYTNYFGKIKYIYEDQKQKRKFGFLQFADADFQILQDGYIIVNKGNLLNCHWYNGQWYGDNWYNGQWFNGVWHCGQWHDGVWYNGTWKITILDQQNVQRIQYRPGDYRTVGVRYVDSEQEIPIRGFFIGETIQYDSSSDISSSSSSYYLSNNFDQWSDQQYESFYGNILNSLISSSNSSNSNSSYQYEQEGKIAVLVKKWVDSKWIQGFIKDIKSFYPPMYGIANQNQYKNHTQDLLYYYPIYNQNKQFLYNQYFFIRCQDASFKVEKNGYIYWYGGRLLNSEWNDGQWNDGIFINGVWNNGTWNNGHFTSGTWNNGTWNNGHITTRNLIWNNGQWKYGFIDQMQSYCSPAIYTANGNLFVNYTGIVKYYNIAKQSYYKIEVQNACFFVSNNGEIVFYNGVWVDGSFIGHWRTSQLNERDYNYLLQQQIIKIGQVYEYKVGSKTYSYVINVANKMLDSQNTLDSFLLNSNGKQNLVNVFVKTNNYISIWRFGTFVSGTWYNGEWIDGQWLTDDKNTPIGKWITGLINGLVQVQPPSYNIVSDQNDFYRFENFTGRIKYKVNQFNDQTYKVKSYLTTFSCKNAYFDIKYQNMTKQKQTFRQVLIVWHDGQWNNGTFNYGIWKRGTWHNGTWQRGLWHNGTWKNGTWISGVWYNGFWEKGSRKHISILNMIYN